MKIIKGDLLASNEPVIGHVVNPYGHMGAGIALQIKKKWPLAYSTYKNFVDSTPITDLLGTNHVYVDDNITIFNMFTMPQFRSFSYHALSECLTKIRNIDSIAFPYGMGSGLAEGNWDTIMVMLENFEYDTDINVKLYKL